MNERFLIPTAVAAALHAVLFFGFSTGEIPVLPPDARVVISVPPPPDTVKVEWPNASSDSEVTPTKGASAEPRPELPELPAPNVTVEIPMPRTNPHPITSHNPRMVPTGPIGIPDGVDGIGPGGPVRSDLLDNPPRTRAQVAPVYPYEARKDGRAGEVFVEFVVDETGRVLDPHVLHSNDPLFEEPTLRAVAKWRFEPGRKNGRVVRFRMAVPVSFAVNP